MKKYLLIIIGCAALLSFDKKIDTVNFDPTAPNNFVPLNANNDGAYENMPFELSMEQVAEMSPYFFPLALPGAEGYGKNTTGGRGGQIYHVTSLSGGNSVGTLRYGMESITGPRCIVFDVSGYIDITSPLKIRNGYKDVSIIGQTSPAGIVIRGAEINVHDDNVIVRFIKIAPGENAYNPGNLPPSDPNYEPADGFTVKSFSGQGGINNVYLDHLSIFWARDGMIDFGGAPYEGTDLTRNITLANTVLAENIEKGQGTLVNGAYNITYYRNIFYSENDRIPALASAPTEGAEFVNNFVKYFSSGPYYRGGTHNDFINNQFERSGKTPAPWHGVGTSSYHLFRHEPPLSGASDSNTRVYVNGNEEDGSDADDFLRPGYEQYKVSTPNHNGESSFQNLVSASNLKSELIGNSGFSLFYDSQDTRINGILNTPNAGANITSESQVGGYPTRPTTTRSAGDDSDNDDMLDVAEIAIWGNLTTATDANKWTNTPGTNIDSYDGYPNIEKTWAWLAGDLTGSSAPPTPTCNDGIQNGDETGVDCGGSCDPCSSPVTPINNDVRKKKNNVFVWW